MKIQIARSFGLVTCCGVLFGCSAVTAFVPKEDNGIIFSRGRQHRSNNNALFALPTLEQLSKDPFMKQVQYGYELTNELHLLMNNNNNDSKKNDDTVLGDSIRAQLSHPEGIRGFMVSYLTADATPADDETIPSVLLDALKSQAAKDPEDLIPLTCKYGSSVFFSSTDFESLSFWGKCKIKIISAHDLVLFIVKLKA
jgi:hypothetical protein